MNSGSWRRKRRQGSASASWFAAAIVLLVGVPCSAAPAVGQSASGERTPGWVGEFTVLAANAAVGALTAALRRALSGGSFQDGFARGAAGGTVSYLGKRLASIRVTGAGLLGRELAAVGHSMVRNASEGRPSFSKIHLPLGPIPAWVSLGFGRGMRGHVRLDPEALGMFVSLATDSRLRFDAGRTVSLGAPVFEARFRRVKRDGFVGTGQMHGGNVVVGDRLFFDSPAAFERTLAHEAIHVIQRDQALVAWSDPLNGALLSRTPLGALDRYLLLNQTWWAVVVLDDVIDSPAPGRRSRSPVELEAEYLTR